MSKFEIFMTGYDFVTAAAFLYIAAKERTASPHLAVNLVGCAGALIVLGFIEIYA